MPANRERVYTIEEARALVPLLRSLLIQLAVEQGRLNAAHAALHAHLRGNGSPDHAQETAQHERTVAEIRAGMNALVGHFEELGIVLRDLDNGLCDIPGVRDGQRIWLCWRLADPDLEYWHSRTESFANRRPWDP